MIWKPEAILTVLESRSSANVGARSLEFATSTADIYLHGNVPETDRPSLASQLPTPLLLLLASPHHLRHISLAILADMVNVCINCMYFVAEEINSAINMNENDSTIS